MDLTALIASAATAATLAADQLSRLEDDLAAEFERLSAVDKKTPAVVRDMKATADAYTLVSTEHTARGQRAGRAAASTSTGSPAAPAAPPAAQADSTSFSAMNAARPGDRAPRRAGRHTALLKDRFGNSIDDTAAMNDAFTRAFSDASSVPGVRAVVASASWADEYPDDRTLGLDSASNDAKMSATTALVASGGICHPVNVDYSVPTLAVADRPLRGALPGFAATRGGIRYVPPVTLTSTADATGVWSAATDAAPGGKTKPVLTLTCGSEIEVLVDAVPTRIRIGNYQGRFAPEQVQNFVETATAAAARVAETKLLTTISAASTTVSSGQLLGASRDLLATIDQVLAAVRYRQRTGDGARFTTVFPSWVKDMMRADVTREHAHEGDARVVTDAEIASWFTVRNADVIWTLDALGAVTGVGGFPAQGWGPLAAGPVLDWPRSLVWQVLPTGSWQFLDGGHLDLGVVRDSTLNSTNDYELFTETFEGLAFRGQESVQVVSALRPNGASAGTVATATSPSVY